MRGPPYSLNVETTQSLAVGLRESDVCPLRMLGMKSQNTCERGVPIGHLPEQGLTATTRLKVGKQMTHLETSAAARSPAAVPLAAAGALFVAYLLVFSITQGPSAGAFVSALINVLALGLCAVMLAGLIRVIRPERLQLLVRFALHSVLAVGFALLWYFAVLAGFATTSDWIHIGLVARSFSENALVWQMYQGVTVYAMIALYLERRSTASTELRSDAAAPLQTRRATGPLLLREGDEIVAVEYDDINRLSGANGYVEVVTRGRTFLSTKSLSQFADTLPEGFLRVHRSHIVRRSAIQRAEPAGNGRLTLHLADGGAVTTSREGARLVRSLAA